MNFSTLNLYMVAAGMSGGLCLVIFIYARFQRQSEMIRGFGFSVFAMATGFFISGFGYALPSWATVIGTNMILIASGVFFHSGLHNFLFKKRSNCLGWAIVIGTAPGFWYWGIIDPNGPYRSALFSFAVAVINARNTHLLYLTTKRNIKNIAAWILCLLFCTATIWMLVRGIHMLMLDPAPNVRAGNPTGWQSILAYIALVSFMTVCVIWMESNMQPVHKQASDSPKKEIFNLDFHSSHKVVLLWSCVAVTTLGIVGTIGIAYANFYEIEKNRWLKSTEFFNESFINITHQITSDQNSESKIYTNPPLLLTKKITQTFNNFYRGITELENFSIMLVDTNDRTIKSYIPGKPHKNPDLRIIAPLWPALEKAADGSFESIDQATGLKEFFVYKVIQNLPLVLVAGLSSHGLSDSVSARIHWFTLAAIAIVLFTVFMALMLTVQIKRRDEQAQFMTMLNHELKTPMSVIRISSDTNSIPENLKTRINRAIDDMNSVIDRCIQSDRLQHGKIKLSISFSSIEEIIDNVIINCSAPNRIDIHVENTPPIETDTQLLNIILTNLIENALKYSPDNQRVTINTEQSLHKGHSGILIKVSNLPTSSGIPNVKKIFNKYYRDEHSLNKTGSGLGLYIAKGFTKKLKGDLRLHATNQLITFELWIPL